MPLNLHEKCLEQMHVSLKEQLGKVEVRNGVFLESASLEPLTATQSILPQTGKIHEALQRYIGESSFLDFVSGNLSRELDETQEYSSERGSVPLSTIGKYADIEAVSKRLITSFESLPWQYSVAVAMPESFSRVFCSCIGQFVISDSVSILSGATMDAEFPLISGIKKRDQNVAGGGLFLLLGNRTGEWQKERAYLVVRVEGFIGKYVATETLTRAINTVRSFVGLLIAQRVLKRNYTYTPTQALKNTTCTAVRERSGSLKRLGNSKRDTPKSSSILN
ncbi:hypothetical protein [Paraburkholderia hospita]|uniref:hypothetical protein n=1 Tax=Paraburkholderia hospita TaxID=169430 RepID=UPI000271D7B0|nr:hypothetical protein [Paraburkholderia hospita]EUC18617.1 hypothetical protein PMI06_003242 [Burkholderia sp. BT03]SKC60136.1 hypothetical protein SAMN06266956_1090 [Paraburkholderia hospita]